MIIKNFMPNKKHIFICVNEKDEKNQDFCSKVGGSDVYIKFKEAVAERGLISQVYVTRTRCLGFCNPVGPTVVIYPEGKWFTEVKEEDYEEIIKSIEKQESN